MSNLNKARMIEVMAIVNLPASNLNRDEMGQPKECSFGGFERTRLSSQSLKYAMRYSDNFKELTTYLDKSLRTSNLHEYVYDYIGNANLSDAMKVAIKKLCETLGNGRVKDKECLVKYNKDTDTYVFPEKIKKSNIPSDTESPDSEKKTKEKDKKRMILVYSKGQFELILETIKKMVDASEGDVDKFSLFKNTNVFERNDFETVDAVSLDTACFGSMSASDAIRSIPAAIQVAQAFSTNAIIRESDYYIAADDFVLEHPDRAQGAANIGNLSFTCPCIYKYAVIDLDILRNNLSSVENLDNVFPEIVSHIVKEFARVLPGGKQNSNAAYSDPALVCVTVKDKKIPCNYANAFETPIEGSVVKSVSEKSIDALVKEMNVIDTCYNVEVLERGWLHCKGDSKPNQATLYSNLNELVHMIDQYI